MVAPEHSGRPSKFRANSWVQRGTNLERLAHVSVLRASGDREAFPRASVTEGGRPRTTGKEGMFHVTIAARRTAEDD